MLMIARIDLQDIANSFPSGPDNCTYRGCHLGFENDKYTLSLTPVLLLDLSLGQFPAVTRLG